MTILEKNSEIGFPSKILESITVTRFAGPNINCQNPSVQVEKAPFGLGHRPKLSKTISGVNNTVKPTLSMQAHSAPLGITFFNYTYVGNDTVDCPTGGGFPQFMDGDAFIAFHGSWNRNPPTGYKVVRVPMNSDGSPKVDEPIDFLCHGGVSGVKFPNGFRPVDVVFDKCNRLLVTSDGTRGSGNWGRDRRYNGEQNCSGCTIKTPSPSQTWVVVRRAAKIRTRSVHDNFDRSCRFCFYFHFSRGCMGTLQESAWRNKCRPSQGLGDEVRAEQIEIDSH